MYKQDADFAPGVAT